MKQIKLDNKFLLVDGDVTKGGIKHEDKIYYYFCDAKNITEDQADDIVEWEEESQYYYLYPHKDWQGDITAIESLHSLIKLKGIHLFDNPYTNSTDLNSSFFSMQTDFKKEKEAEEKTYRNPFIFKL